MSDKPLADALSKPIEIPDIEDESFTLAVEGTQQDKGVTVSYDKDLGKPGGWFTQVAASWWQSAGASVKGVIGWKGKDSG